jgi:DME family drug/metabolite transporter
MAGPNPDTANATPVTTGAALALLAGAGYAVYAVAAKACLTRSRPLPVAAISFSVAAIVLTPALAWIDAPARQVAAGWPGLLYLGVVATAAAYAAYSIGLRRVPASVAGIVALLEPLTATALGVLVFGERLAPVGIAGATLMLGALVVLLTARSTATRRD